MKRRWTGWLVGTALILGIGLAGCQKKSEWGEDIETAPVDVQALREQAKQKKQQPGQTPPAGAPQGQ